MCQHLPGLENGVYHYLSLDHLLEQRCLITTTPDTSTRLLIGLTSVSWREAWKYGERAFRYCQLDTGHAIGALRYAAATLGWQVRIADEPGQQQLAQWLGLDRNADFANAEREEAELLMEISSAPSTDIPTDEFAFVQTGWHGRANRLDAHPMYRWPAINEVNVASRKPPTQSTPCLPTASSTTSLAETSTSPAASLIRQRRSAQQFDAGFTQDTDSFYHLLDALQTHAGAPWDVWHDAARIHPVLFVHRVAGLTPGIYALPRTVSAQAALQTAMRTDFLWQKPTGCPAHLPFYLLAEAPLGKTLKAISCHQAIAADSCFTLAMLAEFDASLHGAPWRYRQLYWEAGLLGQVLYLQAEAANLRGTGIGCYFDDVCHELLGLQDTTFQSLYHFTVGYPLTDHRIANLQPYPHLREPHLP
jgi:nitroreductase